MSDESLRLPKPRNRPRVSCDFNNLVDRETVQVRPRGHSMRGKVNDGERLLIGNNRGGTNGWVGRHALHGRAIRIER